MPQPTISTRRQAVVDGMTHREWREHRRDLARVGVGAYAAIADLAPEEQHAVRVAAVLGRLEHVAATHVSAAAMWGLPVRAPLLELVHVSPTVLRRGRPKSARGYRMHSRALPEVREARRAGLLVSDPLCTVLDCARLLAPDDGVVIADAALHAGLLNVNELADAASLVHRTPGASRARRLPIFVSPLSESPGESLTRLRIRRMGLEVREQVAIGDHRVDLLIEEWLIIEFDGRAKYSMGGSLEAAHWNEKRRHDQLVEAGYEVLRVTWDQLWDEPVLAARVFRGLARARARHR